MLLQILQMLKAFTLTVSKLQPTFPASRTDTGSKVGTSNTIFGVVGDYEGNEAWSNRAWEQLLQGKISIRR
jgi:hypothetical protein